MKIKTGIDALDPGGAIGPWPVTIPGHTGDRIPKGTLKSILKAAGLAEKE